MEPTLRETRLLSLGWVMALWLFRRITWAEGVGESSESLGVIRLNG